MHNGIFSVKEKISTLIWVGFLWACFVVGRGVGGKITPPPHFCLKIVRIMLEASNLARKYTHPYVVPKNTPFFCKKFAFFVQKGTFTQGNSVRAVFDIL